MLDEKELKKEFEGSKDLRIEFGDDFGAFFALAKHQDEVRKKDERRARRRERKTETKVDESELRAEFAASAALKSEFGNNVNLYLAFRRGKAENAVQTFKGGCVTSEPGQKKTEKKIPDKVLHTSEKVRDASQEAVRRAEEIQRDEQKQYESGTPCSL